jgi:hypothetical protein
LKDYALESDNNMITRSAHLMVGTLAGSLAHVTCKVFLLGAFETVSGMLFLLVHSISLTILYLLSTTNNCISFSLV